MDDSQNLRKCLRISICEAISERYFIYINIHLSVDQKYNATKTFSNRAAYPDKTGNGERCLDRVLMVFTDTCSFCMRLAIIVLQALKRRRMRRLFCALRVRMMLRERNKVHSVSLMKDQEDSSWYVTYSARHTPSFVATVSIPPDDFDELLVYFSREYIVKSGPGRPGRPPRVVQKHAVLAMLLHFYSAACEHKTLQELFGVAHSTFARTLNKAELALERALRRIPEAGVRWPSFETQRHWSGLTNIREPMVEGVFGFVDGKNFRVQSPTNIDLQNAQYNGTLDVIFN